MKEIYTASDYAGLKIGTLEFYYGYEQTYCKEHGRGGFPHGHQCDCDDTEWCFVVWSDYKKGKEILYYTRSQIEKWYEYASPELDRGEQEYWLLAGIGMYLATLTSKEEK